MSRDEAKSNLPITSQLEEEKQHRERCWDCYRPRKTCLCGHIKPFDTRAAFVILMHVREVRRERLGTGRLAASCIKGTRLFSGVDFTHDARVNELLEDPRYYPMLLYPGENALNLSEQPLTTALQLPSDKQLLLFLLDGTWPFAKKMLRLSTTLQALPRLCFTPTKPSGFVIKHQPHEHCLSTIEALHTLLDQMDQSGWDSFNGAHHNLLEVFQALLAFQTEAAINTSAPGYRKFAPKPISERTPTKRWETRPLFFKDRDAHSSPNQKS